MDARSTAVLICSCNSPLFMGEIFEVKIPVSICCRVHGAATGTRILTLVPEFLLLSISS